MTAAARIKATLAGLNIAAQGGSGAAKELAQDERVRVAYLGGATYEKRVKLRKENAD
jgi:hypothetical protein